MAVCNSTRTVDLEIGHDIETPPSGSGFATEGVDVVTSEVANQAMPRRASFDLLGRWGLVELRVRDGYVPGSVVTEMVLVEVPA